MQSVSGVSGLCPHSLPLSYPTGSHLLKHEAHRFQSPRSNPLFGVLPGELLLGQVPSPKDLALTRAVQSLLCPMRSSKGPRCGLVGILGISSDLHYTFMTNTSSNRNLCRNLAPHRCGHVCVCVAPKGLIREHTFPDLDPGPYFSALICSSVFH